MTADFLITEFQIKKLWGEVDYKIEFEDNILLLVAENGAGKTIVLSLLFYFLSKQWDRLVGFEFEEITAKINDKDYSFKQGEIRHNLSQETIDRLKAEYPLYAAFIENEFPEIVKETSLDELKKPVNTKDINEKFEIPEGIFLRLIDAVSTKLENFNFDIPVIFFPTYRRQEKTFEEIYGKLRIEDNSKEKKREDRQNEPSDFAKAIKKEDILSEQSEPAKIPEKDGKLNQQFNLAIMIQEFKNMTEERWKSKADSKEIIEYGISDIRSKSEELIKSKDESILEKIHNFISVCNLYFINKQLVLSEEEILLDGSQKLDGKWEIENKKKAVKVQIGDHRFDLDKPFLLSSGEKQIISMFFYIALSPKPPFVIFDEPELSISVNNQEKILGHIQTLGAIGMVVATHSPIIVYRSEFENYQRDLIRDFKLQ